MLLPFNETSPVIELRAATQVSPISFAAAEPSLSVSKGKIPPPGYTYISGILLVSPSLPLTKLAVISLPAFFKLALSACANSFIAISLGS